MNTTSIKRTAWIAWALVTLFTFFQFFLQVASGIMADFYAQSFHINSTQVGFLSSAFFYSFVFMQIPVGILLDQHKARKILISAVFVTALGSLLFAIAPTYSLALIARIIMGAGCGFGFVSMVFVIVEWFPAHLIAPLVGLGEFVGMFGTALCEKFVPNAILLYGWRSVIFGCALINFALFILMLFFFQNPSKHHKGRSSLSIKHKVYQVMSNRNVWLCSIFCCGMFAIITTFSSLWGVPFLQHTVHLSYLDASSAMAWSLLGLAIGGPVVGFSCGAVNRHKTIMLIYSVASLCLTLILFFFRPNSYAFVCGLLFLMGFFSSAYVVAFATVTHYVDASLKGVAVGVCNMVTLMAAIIFQPVSGFLLTTFSKTDLTLQTSYTISLLVFPGLIFCGVIAAILLIRADKQQKN